MKTILVAALAYIALTAVAAEPPAARPQTLLDVLNAAQNNDPVWLGARANYDAAREKLPQARALFLPTLNASANTTDNDVNVTYDSPVIPNTERQYNSHGYEIALTQPLFRAQNFSSYSTAKLQVEHARLSLEVARQDLALRVTQAYFEVLLAQDTLAFVEAQKAATQQQWEQARRSFELGTVTITDTHEAQARLDLINAQEIAAQNDLEVKRHALSQLTGAPPQPLLPLKAELEPAPPTPNELNAWLTRVDAENLQLQMQTRLREIGKREVNRQRAGHLPTLDVVGSYGNSRTHSSALTGVPSDTEATIVGLQLQLPLYGGGAQNSRVREAIANRTRAEQDWERVRREVQLGARQAFLGVSNGVAQVRALEQALISNESALKSNRVGFEVGVRTGVDVLNAQQQYFNAKRDLAQARYAYLLSQLRLQSAVGALNEAHVRDIDRLLQVQ